MTETIVKHWRLRETLPQVDDTVAIDGRNGQVMLVGKGMSGNACRVTIRFQDGVTENGFPIYNYEYPTLAEFLASLEVKP